MRAIISVGPDQVELRELSIPKLKKGWVLIRTLYGGICGSDVTIRVGHHPRAKQLLVMGHEMV
jgi:threonine dehydrogenase-like Zn-dependent dehydrogenase